MPSSAGCCPRRLDIGLEPGTAICAAAAAAAIEHADGDPTRYAALLATIAGLVGVIATRLIRLTALRWPLRYRRLAWR
jgi:uncharacterized membrane protein YadS